jgi:ABC-type branched-subunit amino acid transport system substrate-binding protein
VRHITVKGGCVKDNRVPKVIVAMALLAILAGCTKAEDTADDPDDTSADATTIDPDLGDELLWNDGPCDTSAPKVPLGLIAPFNAGPISLGDQAVAAEVSAEAFNERGGIAGRCIEMLTCDDGADPNQAADCARSMVDQGVVAEINDTVVAAPDVVSDTFLDAGVPRLDGSPAPVAFSAPNIYTLGMGSLGNVVMMVPPLAQEGMKKYAIIRADVTGASALPTILTPMAEAYGGEIVADIPVTTGTSEFTQFILAAQDAGADSIVMATGPEETLQVLRAAQQLGVEIPYSLSLGSVSRQDIIEFGDFADNFVFNSLVPAATADPEPYPLLSVAVAELAASGEEFLQPDAMRESSLMSWTYLYALVKMTRDAELTEITPQTVTEMLNAATEVDMGNLTPPWTPNLESDGLFLRVSQPYYWTASWDAESDNFVMDPDQIDSAAVLAGDVD